jgi:formate hydrogenlyase subunit 4
VTTVLHAVAQLALFVLIAPLLPGLVQVVKAWFAGRRGPPAFQLYYDLMKLWRKGVVLGTVTSPWHVAGPAVAWVALAVAALLVPSGAAGAPVAFKGDALLFVYLIALARFCITGAALDTGSAFEGMGVVREVSFAVLGESAMITAMLALGLATHSVSLQTMLASGGGTGVVLLAAGLFLVLLSENSRVPFDDPNTHLELTMIHEVMVLDHSGPPLAVVLHGAALKLLLYSVVLIQVVWPLGAMPMLWSLLMMAGSLVTVAVGIGLVESLLARLAFRRVPLFLTTAFLLCVFALLVTRVRDV